MTTPKLNSKSPTIRRILREAQELSASPSPDYHAIPLETDLFEWHFTLRGPPNSSYAAGIYHGRIVLPPAYPLKPPSFRFLTPSGRFETNREICLSISGHHEETWQPAWGLRTALVALRSFMETDPGGQVGGLETTDAVRRRLAGESVAFRCNACGRTNGEIMKECEELAREHEGEGKKEEVVEVPSELKMGFRDEMEKKRKEAEASDGESAVLAEGFVQTGPPGGQTQAQAQTQTQTQTEVLQPTRTVPVEQAPERQNVPVQQFAPRLQQQVRVSNEGVPAWIDSLIVVLGVLLVGMIIKVLVL